MSHSDSPFEQKIKDAAAAIERYLPPKSIRSTPAEEVALFALQAAGVGPRIGPKRDPAFFDSDVRVIAEHAAWSMQFHGPLHPSMEAALAEAIAATITEWFENNCWEGER